MLTIMAIAATIIDHTGQRYMTRTGAPALTSQSSAVDGVPTFTFMRCQLVSGSHSLSLIPNNKAALGGGSIARPQDCL